MKMKTDMQHQFFLVAVVVFLQIISVVASSSASEELGPWESLLMALVKVCHIDPANFFLVLVFCCMSDK